MNEVVKTEDQGSVAVEPAGFKLGQWLGRREAFGLIAGRCSAAEIETCLLYTSPSPRDGLLSRMPSSA